MVLKEKAIDRRTQILDAAEELFSYHGYAGTSIREVANLAGVQLASVGYYFGPKEQLLEAVMERRANYFAEQRLDELEKARAKAKGRPIPVERLVHAYLWPFLERVINGDEGWTNYAKMNALLTNSSRWQPVVGKYYDEVSQAFLKEFKKTLPKCSELTILSGFQFMVGAMLIISAETGRYESLSEGRHHSDQIEDIFHDIVPFIAGGFKAVNK